MFENLKKEEKESIKSGDISVENGAEEKIETEEILTKQLREKISRVGDTFEVFENSLREAKKIINESDFQNEHLNLAQRRVDELEIIAKRLARKAVMTLVSAMMTVSLCGDISRTVVANIDAQTKPRKHISVFPGEDDWADDSVAMTRE